MENKKIVLQSPAPLNDGGKSLYAPYIWGVVCGIILGILFELSLLSMFVGIFIVGGGLFGLLIGWGIKNKIIQYRCFGLRTLRFQADVLLPYPELWQRLVQVFGPMNIIMQVNQDGSICVPYDGLLYDIILYGDNSFAICWRQSMVNAIMRQGYYISIYKKAGIAMGMIAYHVQKACQA